MAGTGRRILLVHPLGYGSASAAGDISRKANIMPPLGLAMLAAYLERRGLKADIVDCYADPAADRGIREYLTDRRPALLGFSCTTSSFLDGAHLAAAANYDEIIDYVLESYLQDNIVGEPTAGVGRGSREVLEGLYTLNENERARINFYKNNTIHYFLPVIFISLALLCRAENDEMDEAKLAEAFSDLTDLFSLEFIYSESFLDTAATLQKGLEYLEKRSAVTRSNGRVGILPDKRDELVLFAKAVQDFLESYLVVCDTVLQIKKKMSRKEIIFEIRKNGIKLFKFYFSVSKEVQKERFESRKLDVLKQYKLSPIDNLAQKYWDQYSIRKFQMLSETNRTIAPWTIVRSDNKKQARLNCMKFVLSNMDYQDKLPEEELTPAPEIIISGIDELKHMEENLMQPKELRG